MALLWAFEVWIRYGLSGAHLQFISNLSLCCQSSSTFALLKEESVQEQANPSLWYAIEMQYLEQSILPLPLLPSAKVSSSKIFCCCTQTHLSLKGASKWKTFSLISPQRYYAETPHEFNNLTSFLNRIWIKLSESFSQLKIGQFLSVLDQNLIFSDTLLFTGGKLVSNGTLISPIYFMQYMVTLSWLSVVLTVILEVFLTVRPQKNQPTSFGHSQNLFQ